MAYYNGYQTCGSKENNVVSGNSIDIKMADCRAAEIRADVLIETAGGCECDCKVVRLWGQIKDCQGKPIPNALLKLVRVICTSAGTQYEGIAHTVSDCEGFYQFDLCYCDGTECYKVLVSKAYTEQEQVILTGGGNCHACEPDGGNGGGYHPCKPYTPIITPASGKCGCPTPQPPCPPPCPPKPPCPAPCPPPQPPCPPQYPPCHCSKGGYQYSTGC